MLGEHARLCGAGLGSGDAGAGFLLRPRRGQIELGGHGWLGLGGLWRGVALLGLVGLTGHFVGAWADVAVADEAGAFGDDECAGGQVALDLCVCGEGEAVAGEERALDGAVDDDLFGFDGCVAVGAIADLNFTLCGDLALEVAEDPCGLFEEHLALDAGVRTDDGEFWRPGSWGVVGGGVVVHGVLVRHTAFLPYPGRFLLPTIGVGRNLRQRHAQRWRTQCLVLACLVCDLGIPADGRHPWLMGCIVQISEVTEVSVVRIGEIVRIGLAGDGCMNQNFR